MKKRILFIVFAIVFIVFSSFVRYNDVSSYDIVSGISFDYDGDLWTVTCEICLPSSSNDFGSQAEYVKGTGFTLADALYNAGLQSSNILYIDSVQLYLVSDTVAQNREIYDYFGSKNANLRAVAVITEGEASKVLGSEKQSNDRAKSLSLADKLKAFCRDNGDPLPHVITLVKSGGSVRINKDGLPERRGTA